MKLGEHEITKAVSLIHLGLIRTVVDALEVLDFPGRQKGSTRLPKESRWEKMKPGDVVLIYNQGRIRFAGEIGAKVRNRDLARYFWKEDEAGSTWELSLTR